MEYDIILNDTKLPILHNNYCPMFKHLKISHPNLYRMDDNTICNGVFFSQWFTIIMSSNRYIYKHRINLKFVVF